MLETLNKHDQIAPSLDATVELMQALVALNTSQTGHEHIRCVELLQHELEQAGFGCEIITSPHTPPCLWARREGTTSGRVFLYGHYDVDEPDETWSTPPWKVTLKDGRAYGLGLGDNKGALAVRLKTFAALQEGPELVWCIQGQEESGSALARDILAQRLPTLDAQLWLEENGYAAQENHPRIIAHVKGDSVQPPDDALEALIQQLGALTSESSIEVRSLNKSFVQGGCPFLEHLPKQARYLAIGVNDNNSRVHRSDESIPLWTLSLHAAQLKLALAWASALRQEGER